ncbi:hypothetical protein ACF0H5_016149 [Mactra antiquata]
MNGRQSMKHYSSYVNVLFASNTQCVDDAMKKPKDCAAKGFDRRVRSRKHQVHGLASSKLEKPAECIKLDLDKYLKSNCDECKKPCGAAKRKAKSVFKREKTSKISNPSTGTEPMKNGRKMVDVERQFRSKSVEDALQVIENRKKTIQVKLMTKKEHLLTQEEEQDIHTRADLYAITTLPDFNYCIHVENDGVKQMSKSCNNYQGEIFTSPRKKKRRNYGNTNCYVTQHEEDDIFDNTKMLPIGTRLLKPQTKLVELVAQAISGSPDGLLQVQQIYTYLQNKYPFFRYMDKVAINSWRSSIRHALYQKWFRKIRFDLSFINSKGCYWSINNKTNPKEWSLPENRSMASDEKDICTEDIKVEYEYQELHEISDNVGNISDADHDTEDHFYNDYITTTPTVENTDHVLDTTDWNSEDMYMSSSTESGHGTMSPDISPSFHQLTDLHKTDGEDKMIFIQQTPTKHTVINRPALSQCTPKQEMCPPGKTEGLSDISPLIHWKPDWDEYGSYIISPHSIATQRYISGYNVSNEQPPRTDMDNSNYLILKTGLEETTDGSSPVLLCSDTSDTLSSDFEIIAEYSHSNPPSPGWIV